MKPGKAHAEHLHIRNRTREFFEKRGIKTKTLREINSARAANAVRSRARRRGDDASEYCGGCGMFRSQCQCWDSVNQT